MNPNFLKTVIFLYLLSMTWQTEDQDAAKISSLFSRFKILIQISNHSMNFTDWKTCLYWSRFIFFTKNLWISFVLIFLCMIWCSQHETDKESTSNDSTCFVERVDLILSIVFVLTFFLPPVLICICLSFIGNCYTRG